MDIPRLEAMNKYWKSYPPVHVMIAGYLGIKPESAPKKMSEAEIAELMQQFPQG
jgi:hypothetical protein